MILSFLGRPYSRVGDSLREVQLEEDLEKVPEAAAEQRYARDAEEAGGLVGHGCSVRCFTDFQ